MDTSRVQALVERDSAFVPELVAEIGKVIVGQEQLIDRLLIGLLCDGHVLLEGLPGLAKTLSIRTLAGAAALKFQRIQFTPDLLPADVVGTLIYHPGESKFVVHMGPIFANIVLADEINRAPAKVQSALLEAMQERCVTIGRQTYALEEPFLVLATQNPIEHEGTYPLPEAQLDRFLLHVSVTYPTREEEFEILERHLVNSPEQVQQVTRWPQIAAARHSMREVYVDPRMRNYLLDLVRATRTPAEYRLPGLAPMIRYGASPRAAVHLMLAARAHAFLSRRGYVLPEDVRAICADVLRHRVLLTYEAEADNVTSEEIVRQILGTVDVP